MWRGWGGCEILLFEKRKFASIPIIVHGKIISRTVHFNVTNLKGGTKIHITT
jgi:hypothetical protein